MQIQCYYWVLCYFVFSACYFCSVVLLCVQWVLLVFSGVTLCSAVLYILLPVFVCSEDLDRKMDHKRQQIQSGVQEIRALEQRVNQLRDEKVSLDPILQYFSHLSTSLVPQLKLQERLQEKQGLLTKKEELAAVIQKDERDIKVQAGDIVSTTTARSCVAGRCQDSAVDRWQRSCEARRRQRGSCARSGTRLRQLARQR